MRVDASAVSFDAVDSRKRGQQWMAARSGEDTVRRVAILVVLYLLPSIWILQPVIGDPDVWWHLQTGKWILDHGTVPMTDPFSTFGENKPWIAYSWLFEVGIYGLHQHLGEFGLLLYSLTGTWILLLLLHRTIARRITDFGLVCGLVAACVIAMSKLFTPRPWLLTMIFFALTLEVVLSLREGRLSRWFWGLPVVYVLWANVHVQFIYGLGLLYLACLAPMCDEILSRALGRQSREEWDQPLWRELVTITAMCSLATLVTPYHVRLYGVVIELAGQTGMWDYAFEMMAPSFRTWADWAMLAVFAGSLIRLGQWKRRSTFDMFLLAAGGISAFRGQRDCWLLIMAAIAVFVSAPSTRVLLRPLAVPRGGIIAAIALVIVVSVGFGVYRDCSEVNIRKNTDKLYPVSASAFVKEQGFAGPLYNHFNWGGYLIWAIPSLKVSMDGRANIPGDERIKRSIETWSGGAKWRDDEDLSRAELVIAQRQFALASLLKLDPRFKLVYEDETAAVFIKSHFGDSRSSAFAFASKPSHEARSMMLGAQAQ